MARRNAGASPQMDSNPGGLLPAPGMLRSAIAAQILSAPRRPAPGPCSPNRRSPPKPSGLPDSSCMALRLVMKKLNFSSGMTPVVVVSPVVSPLLPVPSVVAGVVEPVVG